MPLEAMGRVSASWLARMEALPATNRPPPALRRSVGALSDVRGTADFAAALDQLLVTDFKEKLESSSISGMQRHLVELMLALWSVGAVAWPLREQTPFSQPILNLKNRGLVGSQFAWLTRIDEFLDRGTGDDANNFRFVLDAVLSRGGIVMIGDLTPETFHLSPETVRIKLRSLGIKAVIHCLREDYPEHHLAWTPEDFGFFSAKVGYLGRDDEFRWLVKREAEMEHWAKLAREHVANNPTNWKKRKSATNVFLQHIQETPSLPRNPAAYFDVRNRPAVLFEAPGNKGRQTMSVVHEFLNEVLYKTCATTDDNQMPVLMPGFAVPLPKPTYKNVNKGETHRETMPTRLIRQAMAILTEDDFAWPKRIGRLGDFFRWKDPSSGEFKSIWSPVRTYALITKLLLPARTSQIRYLDSGEGDTWRYDEDGSWIKNNCQHFPASNTVVERGVFRRYRRQNGSVGAILYFNTNKTADIDNETQGYVMPWEKLDALRIFSTMRDWQQQYNPVSRATAWTDIAELKRTKHADDLAKMGTNFFLFRDPCNRHRPDLPVTDVRLRGLWLKLMEELEQRLAKVSETLPNGEPIRLIIARDARTNQPSSAVFDLHTLRVTLITAMYEEGVPPEYLMKIVGHASVLMTLYYTKIGVETLSLRMDEALLERQRKAQTEMVGFLQRASRMELEQVVAYRNSSGLDVLASSTGAGMMVMDHGICPVSARRCHEGLAFAEHSSGMIRHLPVPGGASNCVRCRFFLSGPAFLFGLEVHVNDLSFRLKKASSAFEKAQDRFDALSDAYALALDAGEPFHRQRELETVETAFEAATAEVDGIALSLQAAYGLTEQCLRITETQPSDGSGIALVAIGGVDQISAVLAESHEFDQLHRICVGATFFDGLNIDWQRPNLERARLFDRMLRATGYEPCFSLLGDEDALKIANAMGNFLYARVNSETIHALVDGRTTLRAIGLDRAFLSQLENLAPKSLRAFNSVNILDASS